MILAGTLFAFSLFGIIILFCAKAYELAHPHPVRAKWRESADGFALRVKWTLRVIEWYIAHTPQFLSLFGRWSIRTGALWFARLARLSAEEAHRLADMVSHKRGFERRETKSEFLKQVTDHKNGNSGNGSHDQV